MPQDSTREYRAADETKIHFVEPTPTRMLKPPNGPIPIPLHRPRTAQPLTRNPAWSDTAPAVETLGVVG
jgi:hypothetical protein